MGTNYKPQCSYCGGIVGELGERNGEEINAIYDCPRCRLNYCSDCSYEGKRSGEKQQLCLRCDGRLDLVSE